jgi:hypothetical protein
MERQARGKGINQGIEADKQGREAWEARERGMREAWERGKERGEGEAFQGRDARERQERQTSGEVGIERQGDVAR